MTASRYLVDVKGMSFAGFGASANRRQVGMKAVTDYPIRLLRVDVSWTGAVNGAEPIQVSGAPFGLFGLDVSVGTTWPEDPDGAGGSTDAFMYLNGDTDDDHVTRPTWPWFTAYWAAQEVTRPPNMNWRWLPTVGDSHRSFDFQSIGGVRALPTHVLTVSWYVERPDMDDYQLAIIVEEEA